jgi:hypothetical protein
MPCTVPKAGVTGKTQSSLFLMGLTFWWRAPTNPAYTLSLPSLLQLSMESCQRNSYKKEKKQDIEDYYPNLR